MNITPDGDGPRPDAEHFSSDFEPTNGRWGCLEENTKLDTYYLKEIRQELMNLCDSGLTAVCRSVAPFI